jgi:AraC-like DNA-binding protein
MEFVAVNRFDEVCEAFCRVTHAGESWPAAAVTHTAGRLGVLLLSSGRCIIRTLSGAGTGTESAANGGAGTLFLTPVPFVIEPLEPCHCLCCVLDGEAPAALAGELSAPAAQDAGIYPAVSGLLQALCDPAAPVGRRHTAAAVDILCLLEPDAPGTGGWPPLVQEAVRIIRTRYVSLYGVEELADELGVTKSHLVRSFHAALGMTPGRYLTETRIEAARQLLVRGHSLEIVATLCGFSGANYLCKVFKKETGMSPAQYRASVQPTPAAQPLADSAEANLFL